MVTGATTLRTGVMFSVLGHSVSNQKTMLLGQYGQEGRTTGLGAQLGRIFFLGAVVKRNL